LTALFMGLSRKNLELDVVEISGPAFAKEDTRLWSLQALRQGLCHGVVFDGSGRVVEASGALRKRPLIVEAGRFESVSTYQCDMLKSAAQHLRSEGTLKADPAPVLEMTTHDATGALTPDNAELLARVDRLTKLGSVVVSDLPQDYLLVDYLRRYTGEPI